jgi:RHS repeat-associated protein
MKKLAFLLALLPASLYAQNTGPGLPPFGSFTPGGFDTVNNQNLNAVFAIPIAYSGGRGMPLNLSLIYNSNHYQIVGSAWTSTTDSAGNATWGWVKDMPQGGYVTYTGTTTTTKCGTYWGSQTKYSNYAYVDALGTSHPVPAASALYWCGTWASSSAGSASDNSGYYLDPSTLHPSAKVTGPNGQQLIKTTSTAGDVNGNFITKTVVSSTETDWTDSIGNVALKVLYTPNKTNPTQIQYEFLDGNANYQTIKLTLQSLSVKTNFGCSGVSEYTGTATVPQELDIPTPAGGTLKYTFTYEQTPGLTGYYSGRLQRVTLPTGGYYEYDYPGSNDSIKCSDGTTLSMNRVVSDSTNSATWNFVRSGSTTTVTTPKLADTPNANDTLFTFNSVGAETQRKIYKESPGVNVLRTLNTTWASNGTPATRVNILEDGSTESEVDTTIDSNGLLDSLSEYDWGSGARGNLLRTTTLTYQTSTNYTSRNILNLITSEVIKDGSGTIQYRQDTTYDGTTITTCPTGVPQHDDTNYPCSMNYRGNPTQVTTYLTPSTPAQGISKTFTYDVFGNLLTAQLNCCQNKTWTYSTTTQYSQPDSVTSGTSPAQLTTSYQYNLYLGLMTKATDPNNLVNNYSFDFLRRPTQISQSNGSTSGETISYAYNDTSFTTTTTATIDSSKSIQQIASADGLGRVITSTTEDVNSNIYSVVTAKYDLLSRAYSTSNPYTGSASYWTTTQFDVLGRPTSVSLPDNSAISYAFAEQYTTVSDPAGKQRKSQLDGAGRLVAAFEPDINNGNSLTQQTSYAHNVLNELTTVTQGSQTRNYAYDALGRLLSATTPENGTTCFGTVTSGTCNANGYDNFDNLLYRTDARGVLTSYGYDGLNRLTSVSYNVGTRGVPATASLSFTYGTNAAQFNNGLLITMTDGVGSENYAYNALEQMTQLQKVISGTTYTTNYQYNVAGELTQIQYPSGRVVQQSVDPIGRLCEIAPSTTGCGTASSPYATGYGYNVASQATGFKYGNGIYASFGFSSDRLQLNCLDYSTTNRNGNCSHDSTTKFGLTYAYGAAPNNNGQIASITDYVDNGRSIAYTFDPLYRLSTAVTTGSASYPQWGLSWVYDRYGNSTNQTQTAGSPPYYSVSVSASTNRITGSPYAYDLSGNMTNDGNNTLVYDAENRAVSAANGGASGSYTFDGKGLRVTKVSGSTTTVYIFSGSKVIAEYDNGAVPVSPSREYIYGGAALLAKVDSSGTKYYHQDHLSNRLVTDSSGNTAAQMGHFPFGESWYNGSSDKLLFTTYERDSESGNDYAMARYHVNRFSRFSSSDPLPGSTGDPQSLNHYPYTRDDPINFVDPTGLFFAPYCVRVNAGDCTGGGGGDYSWDAAILDFAFSPTGWADDPSMDNLDALDLLGPPPGQFYGGPLDVGGLRGNALVALLNPDCANLFGGFKNAVASLFNSSYNRYVPGQSNPFPDLIPAASWNMVVGGFRDPTTAGQTVEYRTRPGGTIFFAGGFNLLAPGFATATNQATQMTAFFHEQEHAANHDAALDARIDSNYPADFQKINERCKKPQVQQETAPITGELTPP